MKSEKNLLNLIKYDDKIFGLDPDDLGAISREWAQISIDLRGPTGQFALRQALLYQLQVEIVQGFRKELQ